MAPNIYTIPIPSINKNSFNNCLLQGISLNNLSNSGIKVDLNLPSSEKIFIWGIASHSKSIWNRIQTNDFIFFYSKGKIIYSTTLLAKSVQPALAQYLWKEKIKNDLNYEYILFFRELEEVNLPYAVLKDYAGYRKKASVRRFYQYSSLGLNRILNEHSTIESFLLKYK